MPLADKTNPPPDASTRIVDAIVCNRGKPKWGCAQWVSTFVLNDKLMADWMCV